MKVEKQYRFTVTEQELEAMLLAMYRLNNTADTFTAETVSYYDERSGERRTTKRAIRDVLYMLKEVLKTQHPTMEDVE